ncbi:hypothetical protein SAMN05216266_105114 [Amycolatopsis marina]|uniref:Uncharacterized protein n=1 Tax=Amycolatopsis marina TaxID=490629 RepID=A0A1I0YJY5_9PSEU|nr:hypothetical protein SAMN05216266_105114 [Amycolatopsis marina]
MEYPQPQELTIDEPLEPVAKPCSQCGDDAVYRYRLVNYRGWLRVVKCRSCLHVESSELIIAPPQGVS